MGRRTRYTAAMVAIAVSVALLPARAFAGKVEGDLTEVWNGHSFVGVPAPGHGDELDAVWGSGNDVWAVGYDPLIEHWDGSAWSIADQPEHAGPGGYAELFGIAGTADNLWAVGYVTGSNGSTTTLVEQWDGFTWRVLPAASTAGGLSSVAVVSPTDVWAVGSTQPYNGGDLIAEHYSGTSWAVSVLASPEPACCYLQGIAAIGGSDVWAVGADYYSNRAVIEHYDGTQWHLVGSPAVGIPSKDGGQTELFGVATIAPSDIWAVGYYTPPRRPCCEVYYHTLTEHWDGRQWKVVPSPSPSPNGFTFANGSALLATSAISQSDVWAVGGTLEGNEGAGPTLVEHWNGDTWRIVPSASPAGKMGGRLLYGVSATSASIWAVGRMLAPWEIG